MYRETRCACDNNGQEVDQADSKPRTNPYPLNRSQSDVTSAGMANGSSPIGVNGHLPNCLQRRRSSMKFGYHLAVPLARSISGSGGDTSGMSSSSPNSTKNVIALVGLPARGKTYISRKLSRYLNWIGINTKVYNLGDYRRKIQPKYAGNDIFSPDNKEGNALRERVCNEGLVDLLHWLEHEDGEVAVFDATNTTRKRRAKLYDAVVVDKGFRLFFVESVCDREDIIDSNIREVKVTSPDYAQCDEDKVVEDFKARIKHYEEQYETLDENLEPDFSFLKIFNAGEKVVVHKHEGHIQSRIIYYLMNFKALTKRTIYLTRHGESQNNLTGHIGGDSSLTKRGHAYAKMLGEYVEQLPHPRLKIWTSWLKRSIETANHINGVQERWKALNEIDAGACDGMTYADIHENFYEEFLKRDEDKYSYRYPRGESYEDLVARLEPVIMELERQDSVVLVAHQAVIRCLLAYYLEASEETLPWLEVPLHTVIKLEPIAYGCNVQFVKFPAECVVTHRNKPSKPGTLDGRFVNNIPLIDERKTLNGHKNGGRRRVENIGNGSDDEEFYDDLLGQLVVDEKLNHQTEILEEAAVAAS